MRPVAPYPEINSCSASGEENSPFLYAHTQNAAQKARQSTDMACSSPFIIFVFLLSDPYFLHIPCKFNEIQTGNLSVYTEYYTLKPLKIQQQIVTHLF